jgi:hypothetical protein
LKIADNSDTPGLAAETHEDNSTKIEASVSNYDFGKNIQGQEILLIQ